MKNLKVTTAAIVSSIFLVQTMTPVQARNPLKYHIDNPGVLRFATRDGDGTNSQFIQNNNADARQIWSGDGLGYGCAVIFEQGLIITADSVLSLEVSNDSSGISFVNLRVTEDDDEPTCIFLTDSAWTKTPGMLPGFTKYSATWNSITRGHSSPFYVSGLGFQLSIGRAKVGNLRVDQAQAFMVRFPGHLVGSCPGPT